MLMMILKRLLMAVPSLSQHFLIQRLLRGGTGFVLDVKTKLDRASKPANIELWRL